MPPNRPAATPAHEADAYAELHAGFRWQVPPDFNIGEACCGRWARRTPDAVAIVWQREEGACGTVTYADLQGRANRLSGALRRLGVARGDRVAIVMPQRVETAVAHIAIAQLGAVAMPLSMLFGPEALDYRLNDSEACVALVDESAIAQLLVARAGCPALRTVLAVGDAAGQGDLDWEAALAAEAPDFTPVQTRADDAAVLIYTSGTTGPPKGALIPHRALLGNLPGFVASQNGFPRTAAALSIPIPTSTPTSTSTSTSTSASASASASTSTSTSTSAPPSVTSLHALASPAPSPGIAPDPPSESAVFWSPADWAWTGGLMDALLPTLCFGARIVAYQGRFSPDAAFGLMARHRVSHTFLFPTALKAMMKAVPAPREHHDLRLVAIMSAGEAVGDAVFDWCRAALGVTVNEMFGQTEMNYLVGNCGQTIAADGRLGPGWPARPGSMGRPYPGHRIAVLDDDGRECPRGTPGDIALHRLDRHGDPDPIFFLGYWKKDAATRAKFTGDPASSWCRTGDVAVMDADGYLWYQGRADDVFKAAGYRIGPSEIENCLVKHPAVANAAVVPKPDAERGAVVKAYVVLAAGFSGSAALVEQLQMHVRSLLAPYEYPKEIEFIDALPMTTTGKLQRRVLRLQEEERARAMRAGGG